MNSGQILAEAVRHHQAGRLAEAERGYRSVLAIDPRSSDALQLLGVIALQSGQPHAAVELIGQAIALAPRIPEYRNNLGQALQQLGRHHEAEIACRTATELRPDYADAFDNLGNVLMELRRPGDALAAYQRATALQPQNARAQSNLAGCLLAMGRMPEAKAALQTALQLNPALPEAHYCRGNVLKLERQYEAAIDAYRQALTANPRFLAARDNLGATLCEANRLTEAREEITRCLAQAPDRAESHNNLGIVLDRLGRAEEAAAAFTTALRLKPDYAEVHNNLGNVWRQQGQAERAMAAYQAALNSRPDFAEAQNNLGLVLARLGRQEEALAALRQALALSPNYAEAYGNLGFVLCASKRLDEAISVLRAGIAHAPNHAPLFYNLGVALREQGHWHKAIEAFRHALALKPDYALAHSGLLFGLHFDPQDDPVALRNAHRAWDEQHAAPWRSARRRYANVGDSERKLRIGYVSADFREHAVGRNLHPLFAHHDHANFEIFAYAHVERPDAMTSRLRGFTDHWRPIFGLGDADVAELVQRDAIDILIDLSLHSAGNRLLVFARKPAPVQVTFAGYPGTTGLPAIDYRLTDPWLDPAGRRDEFYVERSIRLPHSFWCFDPVDIKPRVRSRDAAASRPIAWGCLNNPVKISEVMLDAWARILQATPASTLRVLAFSASDRERVGAHLRERGIASERVQFVPPQSRLAYLESYNDCDVILDTHPYNGHTTLCDALWMGVPVVSLAGATAVSRGGLSLLSNLGLPEFVAHSCADYVRIAVDLAGDRPRLAELHRTLRMRMEASPLMDHVGFARGIEAAFRAMWREWCQTQLTR